MNIVLSKQTHNYKLTNRRLFLKILKQACYTSGLAGLANEDSCLNIIIINDKNMEEMNGQFLQHQGSTDVITFNFLSIDKDESYITEEDEETIGEIYVCLDTASRAAKEFNTSLAYELILYCVHGMLHICGLDDHCDNDITKMRAEEKRVMEDLKKSFNIEEIIEKLK